MFPRRFSYLAFGLALTLSLISAFSRSVGAAPIPPRAPTFTLQDLGPLPFVAEGDVLPSLSDSGQVCFWQERSDAVQGAVWSQGLTRILPPTANYLSGITNAVNDRGEVAGWLGTSGNIVDSRSVTRACVWSGSGLKLLGTLGGQNSQAFGINSRGSVVGDAQRADGARHAFLAENRALRDLGTLPGGTFSRAYAINSAGDTVGVSSGALPYKHAVCWQSGKVTDLGLLPGGRTSSAQAINSVGQIVGFADTPDGTHAFLYSHGKMQDLGTLGEAPSAAVALNDQGQVVGTSDYANDLNHAFLWQSGVMIDLNKLIAPNSPWLLLRGCAINNHGQIVCIGRRKIDQTAHTLLLTPLSAHAD